MPDANTNNDGGNAGAGGDAGQNTNAGDGTGGNAGAGDGNTGRTLGVSDIGAIAESVGETLGLGEIKTQMGTLGQTVAGLKTELSTEITAAVTRQLNKALKAGGDNKAGDDKAGGQGGDNAVDPLTIQVAVGDETLTVADLVEAKKQSAIRDAEIARETEARAQQDKVRRIADAMRERNFAGLVDVLANGLANSITVDDNNGLIAKSIQKTNSLGTKVTTDMPMEEYLDMLAKENPTMVLDQTRTGTGGTGGGDGSTGGGEGEFTVEKALADPALYDKWLEADPAGCQAAFERYQQGLVPPRH